MRIQLALAAATALLPTVPAQAATFGELPLQHVNPAACVRATGAPGELVRWAPRGARVWQAGSTASTPVSLGGTVRSCPDAAAQPGDAGVVAAMLANGGLAAALRDPGAGWSAPTTLVRRSDLIDDLSTAASARGDAAVAWVEGDISADGAESSRVRVARRTPGGPFGAAVELARFSDTGPGFPRVRIGLDAAGGAVVLWTATDGTTQVAFAPAGGAFGAPQPLATGVSATPSLAVAPDGRALAVLPGNPAQLAEREPGAAFAAPVDLPGAADDTAVTLRADGAAIVAWGKDGAAGAQAQVRSAPGPFGTPQALGTLAGSGLGPGTVGVGVVSGSGVEYPLEGGGSLRAAFTGDGRPLIAWRGPRTSSGFDWTAAFATTLDGPAQALGSPLRDAGATAPVILASGAAAVAWSDDDDGGDGHVHVALDGTVARPQPAFARVTVGPPVKRAIGRHDPLVLHVRCAAACDVRAKLARPGAQSAFASRSRAGTTTLTLYSNAPIGPGIVTVDVVSGPPGATAVRSQTVRVKLSRKR